MLRQNWILGLSYAVKGLVSAEDVANILMAHYQHSVLECYAMEIFHIAKADQ